MLFDDKPEFARVLAQTFSVYAVTVTKPLMNAFWSVLEPYTMQAVSAAFTQHVSDYSGYGYRAPTPADILKQLNITMPELARQHCYAVLRSARERIAPLDDEINRIKADVYLRLVSDLDARERIRELTKQIVAIQGSDEVRAARLGVQFREKTAALPAPLQKAIQVVLNGNRD